MAAIDVTPQNLTEYDRVLKDFYLAPIRDILNSKTILLNRLNRDQENISGRQALIPLNIGRNEGLGWVGDGAFIPDPDRQRFEDASIPMKWFYQRILFTGPTVAASRNSEGAFARVLDAEIRGAARDSKNAFNRTLFGDGSGRLAQIASVATAVYTVTNPGGFANVGPGIQYLRPNMLVCVFDEAGDTMRGTGVIVSVDVANDTITLAAAITGAVANDYFYRVSTNSGAAVAPSIAESHGRFNEPLGIAAAVSDADIPGPGGGTRDYLGIDRTATVPNWRSPVIANGGTPVALDLDVMQQAEDASDLAGDGQVTIWITTHGLRRAYLGLLQTDKRYVNTMQLDGGWTTLEYNGKPLVPDKHCTWGRMYGLDEDCFAMYQMSPIFWIDDDGHILHRLPDQHAFQASLAAFWELGCSAPNRSVLIDDLLDPVA